MSNIRSFFVKIGNALKRFFCRVGLLFCKLATSIANFVVTLPKRLNAYRKTDEGKKAIFEIIRTIIAVALALLVAIIIIACASKSPLNAIKVFLTAPFSSDYIFAKMLTEAIPLIFTGVAVCLMVRCGQFNMIGEGSFFAGAFIGAVVAAYLKLPPIISPIISIMLASIITGAVGYIPAKLKARLNVSELVVSLMMNFIMLWLVLYLLNNHLGDPDFPSSTPLIPDSGKLPFLSADNELSSGLILSLVVAVLTFVFLSKTKYGYAIRMTGENVKFARYSGINSSRAIVYSQVIGSGIAGMGGAAFMLGNFYRFSWKALPNYGFDGFIVAIMARNKPLLVPIVALLFGYMRTGAMEMARLTDVPNEVIFIVQAVMIILVGAHAFYEFMRKRSAKIKAKKAALTATQNTCEEGKENV